MQHLALEECDHAELMRLLLAFLLLSKAGYQVAKAEMSRRQWDSDLKLVKGVVHRVEGKTPDSSNKLFDVAEAMMKSKKETGLSTFLFIYDQVKPDKVELTEGAEPAESESEPESESDWAPKSKWEFNSSANPRPQASRTLGNISGPGGSSSAETCSCRTSLTEAEASDHDLTLICWYGGPSRYCIPLRCLHQRSDPLTSLARPCPPSCNSRSGDQTLAAAFVRHGLSGQLPNGLQGRPQRLDRRLLYIHCMLCDEPSCHAPHHGGCSMVESPSTLARVDMVHLLLQMSLHERLQGQPVGDRGNQAVEKGDLGADLLQEQMLQHLQPGSR